MNSMLVRSGSSSPGEAAYSRYYDFLRWALWAVAVCAALGGCSINLVSTYDKDAVDRINEMSKSTLKFYQDLLAVKPSERPAAIAGPLRKAQGDIDTQMRLHLVREEARSTNQESINVANNLLESWKNFTALNSSGKADALNDAALGSQRSTMERHLKAAFAAEEAKKLGGSPAKST